MTDQRWQRVKALFHAAVERPVEERHTFLVTAAGDDDELRREVEALLTSDAAGSSFLDRLPVAGEALPADHLVAPPASMGQPPPQMVLTSGRRLGAYEIVAPLGAGGCGKNEGENRGVTARSRSRSWAWTSRTILTRASVSSAKRAPSLR